MSVYVSGVGSSPFQKPRTINADDLALTAVRRALQDAQLEPHHVDVAYCSHSHMGRVAGQRILHRLAFRGTPVINVESACAGGAAAIHSAVLALQSGRYGCALVLGVDDLSTRGPIPPNPGDYEGYLGKTLAAKYALRACRHMERFGLTIEQLARVSVKNHKNGLVNSIAQLKLDLTIDDVMSARMIAEPLTLYHCCPTSQGAAALILTVCPDRPARRRVRIAASSLSSGAYQPEGSTPAEDWITIETARKAFAEASCGPRDIHVAEVHDAFTIGEILAYEQLGFCEIGNGGVLVSEGHTERGGRLPVNAGGGLLARGHPLGATGVAQVAELALQLRGDAGANQVGKADLALAHTIGGSLPRIGMAACGVHILEAA